MLYSKEIICFLYPTQKIVKQYARVKFNVEPVVRHAIQNFYSFMTSNSCPKNINVFSFVAPNETS